MNRLEHDAAFVDVRSFHLEMVEDRRRRQKPVVDELVEEALRRETILPQRGREAFREHFRRCLPPEEVNDVCVRREKQCPAEISSRGERNRCEGEAVAEMLADLRRDVGEGPSILVGQEPDTGLGLLRLPTEHG